MELVTVMAFFSLFNVFVVHSTSKDVPTDQTQQRVAEISKHKADKVEQEPGSALEAFLNYKRGLAEADKMQE